MLKEYDKRLKGDHQLLYELIPDNELRYILNGNISEEEKKKMLLHEIGIARINLFTQNVSHLLNL
jgi:hypothetical protein